MERQEVKPKEQPMLFKTPMIKSILDGSKTETRRTQKLKEINESPDDWRIHFIGNKECCFRSTFFAKNKSIEKRIKVPWEVGNVLWCKETWKPSIRPAENVMGEYPMIRYKADGCECPVLSEDYEWFRELTKDGKFNYQSSMFMRRKFARIFLKITEVKIERLQDITNNACIAEGIESKMGNRTDLYRNYLKKDEWTASATESYKSLWDSINGEGSWGANPFCWVVKFQKLEKYAS